MMLLTQTCIPAQASVDDDPVFETLFNVVDNRMRLLQRHHIGQVTDKSVALPASILTAMFATKAWDARTPEGLQQRLVAIWIRDFILRVNQVYNMCWYALMVL